MRPTATPRRRRRPSAAFALAFVALLVALGGTSYAAATISGTSIKVHSLPGNRIVSNAVTGTQVNENTLGVVPKSAFSFLAQNATSADTAKKALTADSATTAKTADTATTATSADTAKLADQAKDTTRFGGQLPSAYLRSGAIVRFNTTQNVAANTTVELNAVCQPGEIAVGGGGGWFIVGTDTSVATGTLSVSIPTSDGGNAAWRMEGKNTSAVARDARAYVVCMSAGTDVP